MRRARSRVAATLAVLALAGGLVGNDCGSPPPVVTLESLQAQVEEQRLALCAVYEERGLTLDLPSFADPDCP